MKHSSSYLDWYARTSNVTHNFKSSGIGFLKYRINLGETDLSTNFLHGNPTLTKALANMYHTKPGNVFVSSEGASGQNARIVRCLAERNPEKNEAIVEFPTYEPLLRQVQEYFPHVKRLKREASHGFGLDSDHLRKLVSDRTGLLVLTNPHAPSNAIASTGELKEIMNVANAHDFFVLCDEIYAEFDRSKVPTLFSIDHNGAIVTTSFTKAYGLGGLKLGIALANDHIVDELYLDVLNTVGNTPNILQLLAAELLTKGKEQLESHKKKWTRLKSKTEEWLKQENLEYSPNSLTVTYWVKLPLEDTLSWMNTIAIPRCRVAAVPGAYFLFKSDYALEKSKMIRLGLGAINPDSNSLQLALDAFHTALRARASK